MTSPQTDHQAAFSPDHLTLETWGPEFPAVPQPSLQMALWIKIHAELSWLGSKEFRVELFWVPE